MSEWQPIETAPKDRDFIGLYWGRETYERHGTVVRCWWQEEFEMFISSCRQMTMAAGLTFADGKQSRLHSPEIETPTHWMEFKPPKLKG